MMQLEHTAPPRGDTISLAQQAKALGLLLREEFDAPFSFYDATTGALVVAPSIEKTTPVALEAEAAIIRDVALDGRARVSRVSETQYRVMLVLHLAGKAALVGVARLPALTSGGAQGALELARLQKWVQAIADRVQLNDQPTRRRPDDATNQANAAWEVVFAVNQLVRRLRIHRDPEKNQRRILEAAHGLLRTQTLLWVPQQQDAPVLIQGEPTLAAADCRQLANVLARHPELKAGQPLMVNAATGASWNTRFPSIQGILAFHIEEPGVHGWVIALNKQSGTPFRRGDAMLLLPFVSLLELHLRASGRYQELKDLLVSLTRSLTSALDAKDPYTFGHSERVARIAVELGRELALSEDELGDIYLAGLLHDVGKIGIRDTVLCKAGALTPEEFEHIKQHVTIGYTILSGLKQIRNLLPGVLYHHERYDGTGYPDKLAGEAIPLMGRILAVADAYDAMSTTRPYRDAMACRRVEEILIQGADKQWDGRIIDAFVRCRQKVHAIRQRGVGDSLRLAIDGALRTISVTNDKE